MYTFQTVQYASLFGTNINGNAENSEEKKYILLKQM